MPVLPYLTDSIAARIEPLLRKHGPRRCSVDDAAGGTRSCAAGTMRVTVVGGARPTLF